MATATETSLRVNGATSNFSGLFHLVRFVKCWQIFLEVNSTDCFKSSGKERESRFIVFTSSAEREIRHFHVVVVQRRQRSGQKGVMQLLFCQSKAVAFLPFLLPSPTSLLKLCIYGHVILYQVPLGAVL